MQKQIKLIRTVINKYWDVISYLIFGVLTTIVNFLVYFPIYNWLQFSATFSNVIAWIVAVAFAYLTNKPFVFKSHDWSRKTVLPELTKFIGCRIGSGFLETVFIWITVDILVLNGNFMKVIVSVAVVILNYIGSKFLVFTNKKK